MPLLGMISNKISGIFRFHQKIQNTIPNFNTFFFKFLDTILLLSILIGCAIASPLIRGNPKGQPGCKTDEELKVRLYAYHDDPQLFWQCVEKGVDAVCWHCPKGTLFQPDIGSCIRAEEYKWCESLDPLSLPDVISNSCSVPENVEKPTNGQPGCKTPEEIEKRLHPNPDDITRFWECTALNKTAICRKCPESEAFEVNKCVTAGEETWQPFEQPASSPDPEDFVKCY